MPDRPDPPAQPHGPLRELLPDVFFVTGSVAMTMGVTMRMSRNMTVIRQDGELTLVNSVRLTDDGLAELEALGTVRHVLRLAAFHGMDDAFYQRRYGAKVWAVKGSEYRPGFGGGEAYFEPDALVGEGDPLPVAGRLLVIDSRPPDGLLALDTGVMVAGDSLQNIHGPDEHFNLMGRLSMRLMGFFKPHNVGPGWLRAARPDRAGLRDQVLGVDFDHLLPAHGEPVLGGAKDAYRPRLEAL